MRLLTGIRSVLFAVITIFALAHPAQVRAETYSWNVGSFGTCSEPCGGGTQTRTVVCQDSGGATVADSFCTTTKPATAQSCNVQACETYSWNVGAFGTCSEPCGGGTQTRTVVCQDSGGATVADSFCTTTKPATAQSCNVQTCETYSWNVGAFGTCSEPCGGGTQTRTVVCQSSGGATVADSFCTTTKPATAQSCNVQACETYSWNVGAFGTCSEPCGGGTQTRTVVCQSSGGATVADSFCTTTKPATAQSCNVQACETYSWNVGAFGTCSEPCGGGTQTRTVVCQSSGGATVADSFCTTTKPATAQSCNVQACETYSWNVGSFGTCSALCGGGTQTRTVVCQSSGGATVADSICTTTKPAETSGCNHQPCCEESPRPTCDAPAVSLFAYARSTAAPDKRTLQLRFLKGSPAREVSEFGDPTVDTAVNLCLYGNGVLLSATIIEPGTGEPGWSAPSNGKALKYLNRDSQGIGSAGIQAGAPGEPALSKVQVKGKGADVVDLALPLEAPVAVQVVNSSTGACVGDTWDVLDLNDAAKGKFKARRR